MQVFVTKDYLAVASEFVEGDSVSDYLTSPENRTTARCRALFQQLILAIEYCHSRVRPQPVAFAALHRSVKTNTLHPFCRRSPSGA